MPEYDPEGLLSTLPAVATTLFGVLAGRLLRSGRSPKRITSLLALAGAAGVAGGLLWSLSFPINKPLWTSSFCLFTAGASALGFSACYGLVDVLGARAWSKPFEILGLNAIAIYFVSDFIYGFERHFHLKTRLYEVLLGRLDAPGASLAFALADAALCLGLATAAYRRRLFIKV